VIAVEMRVRADQSIDTVRMMVWYVVSAHKSKSIVIDPEINIAKKSAVCATM
jgi:hypothetical protein